MNILDTLDIDPKVRAFAKSTGARFLSIEQAIIEMPLGYEAYILTRGAYNGLADVIVINNLEVLRGKVLGALGTVEEVILHELSHWSGHPNRLNRDSIKQNIIMESTQTPPLNMFLHNRRVCHEEATAQMGMYLLATSLGLDSYLYSQLTYDYLSRLTPYTPIDTNSAHNDALKIFEFFKEKVDNINQSNL